MINNDIYNIENSHFNGDEGEFNWFLDDPSTNFLSSNNHAIPSNLNHVNSMDGGANSFDSFSSQPWIQSPPPLTPLTNYQSQSTNSASSSSSPSSSTIYSSQSTPTGHLSPNSLYNFSNTADGSNIFNNSDVSSQSFPFNYNCLTPSPPPPAPPPPAPPAQLQQAAPAPAPQLPPNLLHQQSSQQAPQSLNKSNLQPVQATALAYPYQRPVAIQPNLGYTHKVPQRFISPYMTTNVGGREIILWSSRSPPNRLYSQQATQPHMASLSEVGHPNRLPIMISAGRMAFSGSLDDSSSPSSSCSTPSTTSYPGTMDKKLFMNNPVLVNMLTCPQIPGLRNLAPAPDSSSSHFDEKSKNEILSGLIDVSGEKRKRSTRVVATTSREPIKREIRPKIFDIEQFKIGLFHVQSSSNEGSRRGSSTQLKVIFSKRRFIYEFAFPCSKKDPPPVQPNQSPVCISESAASSNVSPIQSNINDVVYYVIAVPFETVTGLNIDDSTMYLTVDRVPFLFGGTSVRSKVLFEKAPQFDPSQGELESNALHCISLRPTQVGRLRTSLADFDKRFADLLSTKIGRDPYSYRCKLSEGSREEDSEQPLKKPKLAEKIN